MKKIITLLIVSFIFIGLESCKDSKASRGIIFSNSDAVNSDFDNTKVFPGAYNIAKYLPLINNKNVALVVNQSSTIDDVHLTDTLLNLDVKLVKIFAPEHGFRGKADAGEHLNNSIDSKTGLPIVSLYGKKKAPDAEDLKGVDVIVFDIQDVGVRFYTYISTMAYIMNAAKDNDIPVIILDRPNPNGHYIDGPVLEEKFKSFVGMFPIPVVYGMTIGELATMINGEGWLNDSKKCDLTVVKCTNYTHLSHYRLPIAPSPNLPDFLSVSLYPSLCFFEGTTVSVGRGTDKPFKQLGHPLLKDDFDYSFIPKPNLGAKNPKYNGQKCYGIDLSKIKAKNFRAKGKIDLSWLIDFFNKVEGKGKFFLDNNWIDKLAGTDKLRKMILQGKTDEEIHKNWENDLERFNKKRKKYLLYTDF